MTSKYLVVYLLLIGWVSSPAEAKLKNFRQVDPNVFRGSQPLSKKDYESLSNQRIRTILSLQTTPHNVLIEKVKARKYGFTFINVPIWAIGRNLEEMKDKVEVALKVMDDPALQPVYVHCLYGKHRTSLVVGMYRIHFQHWPADAAKNEMEKFDLKPSGIEYYLFQGMNKFFEKYKAIGSLNLNKSHPQSPFLEWSQG